MKKYFLQITLALVISFGFISCEHCIKCEIVGNIPDTTSLDPNTETADLLDTNNAYYDEFCGSSSEIEAFETDVEFAAVNRECRIYAIRKIQTYDTMATMIYCGGWRHLAAFENGLDTLILTTYANQDAEWVLDTALYNPASWVCK